MNCQRWNRLRARRWIPCVVFVAAAQCLAPEGSQAAAAPPKVFVRHWKQQEDQTFLSRAKAYWMETDCPITAVNCLVIASWVRIGDQYAARQHAPLVANRVRSHTPNRVLSELERQGISRSEGKSVLDTVERIAQGSKVRAAPQSESAAAGVKLHQ